MKYAILGFALGVILAGAVFWGIYSTATDDAERRLDESIKRSGKLIADAQSELERERQAHELTRGSLEKAGRNLDIARKQLAGSLDELGRLRSLQNQDGIAIDGSLEGIERIRAIIEGLPILE